jgi:hypothetical protein
MRPSNTNRLDRLETRISGDRIIAVHGRADSGEHREQIDAMLAVSAVTEGDLFVCIQKFGASP